MAFLYAWSFEFDKEIEIYKFGASAWPRAILLLIAVAAIGQLAAHCKAGGHGASGAANGPGVASDTASDAASDSTAETPKDSRYAHLKWHLSTFSLLSLPFFYMLLPEWIQSWFSADKSALHSIKLACAGVLIPLYIVRIRANPVGAILALPVFFGALMQDIGFYSLAPFFAAGVMWLMGERRPGWIVLITAFIFGLLLLLFVSVLYVGLPTGNISPFYEIGTGLVNLLQ